MAQMGGNVILAPLAARNPMVEDLDGNGYAILDLDRVETNALLGTISEKEIQQLDGAGLYVDENGRLSVNSDVFDGDIDGLSNPLTEDLDAAGYNIDNASSLSGESVNTDETVSDSIRQNYNVSLTSPEDPRVQGFEELRNNSNNINAIILLSKADSTDSYLYGRFLTQKKQSSTQGQRFADISVISRYNSHRDGVSFSGREISHDFSIDLLVGDFDGETWVCLKVSSGVNYAGFSGIRSGEANQLSILEDSDMNNLEPWNEQVEQDVDFSIRSKTEFP